MDLTRRGFLFLFAKSAALLAVAPIVLPKLALAEPKVVKAESGLWVVDERERLLRPDALLELPESRTSFDGYGTVSFTDTGGSRTVVIEPRQCLVSLQHESRIYNVPGLRHAYGWLNTFDVNQAYLLTEQMGVGEYDFYWAMRQPVGGSIHGRVYINRVDVSGSMGKPLTSRVEWVSSGPTYRTVGGKTVQVA